MRPLLIVKAGGTLPEIAIRRGDFEDWISAGLALAGAPVHVARVYEGDRLPGPEACSGVVVTGSSAMVSERLPWSERTAGWLADAVAAGTPILGICYGHQLLAHALGGRVGANPIGREIGTVGVARTAEPDPLLDALPRTLVVHATHVESVISLPRDAVLLGTSERDRHQAFRIGERAWGVQFHPEFDADIVRGYIHGRRVEIEAEGSDADALLAGCRDSEHGPRILARFGEIVRAAEGEPSR